MRSYSYKDRDAWVKAFNKLIQYKREVLRHRGINFDEVFTCPDESRSNYDLTLADFDEHGFIKDLHMISHSNNDVMLIDSIQRKSLKENQQIKSQNIEETTNIRRLQPSDHELLKKYFNDQQERIQPIGARSRNERAHK